MSNQVRTFTVEEANQLIPALSELLVELKHKQNQVVDMEAQIDALELVSEGDDRSIAELNSLTEQHHERVSEFYRAVDRIHNYGCLLKDVEIGLIDFYSVIDGKVVYLCWKLGEQSVGHWHDVEKGFPFRKPLSVSPNEEPDKIS